jgi:hypothetical protein
MMNDLSFIFSVAGEKKNPVRNWMNRQLLTGTNLRLFSEHFRSSRGETGSLR